MRAGPQEAQQARRRLHSLQRSRRQADRLEGIVSLTACVAYRRALTRQYGGVLNGTMQCRQLQGVLDGCNGADSEALATGKASKARGSTFKAAWRVSVQVKIAAWKQHVGVRGC